MAIEHLLPVPQKPEIIDFFPVNTYYDIDIACRKCCYRNPWTSYTVKSSLIVHFGHSYTKQSLYNCEVYKLRQMIKGKRIFISKLFFIRIKCFF